MVRSMIIHGDALEELRKLEDNSVDAIVCDPPAGISFMGKDWDNFGGAPAKLKKNADKYDNPFFRQSGGSAKVTPEQRQSFISFLTDVMAEALRVLKPGGHALVWSLPRTSHWTALALEDAGFEIRDCVYHIFGSGFPKSLNVSAAIDKHLHAEREVIGSKITGRALLPTSRTGEFADGKHGGQQEVPITAPATPEAQQYAGFGTALKPAAECWWLCRKPLAEKSVAANVLKYGTGGLNIDGCRVGNDTMQEGRGLGTFRLHGCSSLEELRQLANIGAKTPDGRDAKITLERYERNKDIATPITHTGRWPSHLLLSHTLLCTEAQCAEGCPVAALDEQSGIRKCGSTKGSTYGGMFGNGKAATTPIREASEGGASRYFATFRPEPFIYAAKASRRERNEGCEALPVHTPEETTGRKPGSAGLVMEGGKANPYAGITGAARQNNHPTVKSQNLMKYLVRMITPPGGVVLDCFGGSGSTAIACISEGMDYIIIEREQEYIEIIRARVAHAEAKAKMIA